jgi:hypothetical protein
VTLDGPSTTSGLSGKRVHAPTSFSLAMVCTSNAGAQDLGFRGFVTSGRRASPRPTVSMRCWARIGASCSAAAWKSCSVVGIFFGVSASRFQKDGTRVFVFNNDVFSLGIPTTIRVTPFHITGGYRFKVGRRRIIPYAGGGVGWYRYSETSDFAADDENVSETFTGYHVLVAPNID